MQALKEIPSFGLRKQSNLDRIFADLIEEKSSTYEEKAAALSSRNDIPEGLQGAQSDGSEGAIGSIRFVLPSHYSHSCNRIPATVGEAILHYESPVDHPSPAPMTDILGELLGDTVTMPPLKPTSTPSELKLRLEYDESVISPKSAAAYLEHVRYHLELPDQTYLI
jgi:hypothetical protein